MFVNNLCLLLWTYFRRKFVIFSCKHVLACALNSVWIVSKHINYINYFLVDTNQIKNWTNVKFTLYLAASNSKKSIRVIHKCLFLGGGVSRISESFGCVLDTTNCLLGGGVILTLKMVERKQDFFFFFFFFKNIAFFILQKVKNITWLYRGIEKKLLIESNMYRFQLSELFKRYLGKRYYDSTRNMVEDTRIKY